MESGEWTILSLVPFEENVNFNCCPEPFASIKYKLELSRKSLYYFLYVILPLVALAFLFLLVFHIPYDSGERMGFGVTILLSITVYLLVISDKLPEKSTNTPLLGVCFIIVFFILCAALGLATITIILARRESEPPMFLQALYYNSCCKKKSSSDVKPSNSTLDTVIEFRELGRKQQFEKSEETVAINNSELWTKISRYLDKRLFIFFNMLLVIIPMITILCLPTSGYGG